MPLSDKEKALKMEKIYERYIEEVLSIIRAKLDTLIEFRLRLGKKKLQNLEEKLEDAE